MIKILKSNSLITLHDRISANIDLYCSENECLLNDIETVDIKIPGIKELDYEEINGIAIECKENLAPDFKPTDPKFLSKVSQCIFSQLSSLPRNKAIDERLWTYLAHGPLRPIVQIRWPLESKTKQKAKYINNHYFINHEKRDQGLVEQHGISSFWWIGKIVSMVEIFENEKTMKILLEPGMLRNIRYHNYMRGKSTLEAFIKITDDVKNLDVYKSLSTKKFNPINIKSSRNWIDELSIYLHRLSGVRMLSALDTETIITIMKNKIDEMSDSNYVPEKPPTKS